MIMSLLFPVLLRFTAGVLFWIFIFGVIGIMGYGIWHCYWEYDHLKRIPGSDLTVYDTGFQRDFRVCLQLRQTWLAFRALLAAGYWVLLGTFLSPHTPPRPHHLPPSGKSAHRHPQQAPSSCHQLPPGPHRAALGGHHHPPVLGGPGAGLPFRRQGTCAWP
ncbi:choline transporter-like protein 5 isoform X3 [Strigops habroptila]|uniref:choline transporter-like protein 5 isoform X3 n=1 Tax=Strigops habroptila TaxID=2489341 RepID=UPI0011CF8BBA|nr:choline transporter-like protein 5 isoform X3 [Strigops habroptila]